MFFLIGGFLCALLCLHMTLQLDVHHHAFTQIRITAKLLRLHKSWQMSPSLEAVQLRAGQGKQLFDLLRRADQARSFLLRHIRLNRLDALLLLRTGDASRAALLSGAAQAIATIPRKNVCIRILPDFFRAHSTLQGRCIIRVRLGILLLTMMMLLAAHLRQRHAEREA